jgi:excinuclease UvrABC nuclease subunit
LIELVEDSFDLCRYYNILVQAPRGRACAYKEMGKCPAPCDGSITMPQYRRMVEWSAKVAVDNEDFVREQGRRMKAAAGELRFEVAGRIKGYIDQVSQFGKGPYRHAGRLEDFVYVSVQRGPREGTAKVFLVTPGEVEEVAGLIGEPGNELLRELLERARTAEWGRGVMTKEGQERVGIVAHHLFLPKKGQGVFLRLDRIEEGSIARAYRELKKQKVEEAGEGEGVVKELQAMGE